MDTVLDNCVESSQCASLHPLVYTSTPIGLDEAMASADHGNALRTRDGPVDDVGSIPMRMQNIRALLPTERANRASLPRIIAIADV